MGVIQTLAGAKEAGVGAVSVSRGLESRIILLQPRWMHTVLCWATGALGGPECCFLPWPVHIAQVAEASVLVLAVVCKRGDLWGLVAGTVINIFSSICALLSIQCSYLCSSPTKHKYQLSPPETITVSAFAYVLTCFMSPYSLGKSWVLGFLLRPTGSTECGQPSIVQMPLVY